MRVLPVWERRKGNKLLFTYIKEDDSKNHEKNFQNNRIYAKVYWETCFFSVFAQ